jgi:hypothetical protein
MGSLEEMYLARRVLSRYDEGFGYCPVTALSEDSLLGRIDTEVCNKQQARCDMRQMSLIKVACISVRTIYIGTMAISLVKMLLIDRRCVSKAALPLYRLSL